MPHGIPSSVQRTALADSIVEHCLLRAALPQVPVGLLALIRCDQNAFSFGGQLEQSCKLGDSVHVPPSAGRNTCLLIRHARSSAQLMRAGLERGSLPDLADPSLIDQAVDGLSEDNFRICHATASSSESAALDLRKWAYPRNGRIIVGESEGRQIALSIGHATHRRPFHA
jgi:hypothetical protein